MGRRNREIAPHRDRTLWHCLQCGVVSGRALARLRLLRPDGSALGSRQWAAALDARRACQRSELRRLGAAQSDSRVGGHDNMIRLWDPETGRMFRALRGHARSVLSVVWAPDGLLLASGSHETTIRLWDAETGQEVNVLEGHTGAVLSVSFSADGRFLASKSRDNTVRLCGANMGSGRATRRTRFNAMVIRSDFPPPRTCPGYVG